MRFESKLKRLQRAEYSEVKRLQFAEHSWGLLGALRNAHRPINRLTPNRGRRQGRSLSPPHPTPRTRLPPYENEEFPEDR